MLLYVVMTIGGVLGNGESSRRAMADLFNWVHQQKSNGKIDQVGGKQKSSGKPSRLGVSAEEQW